MQHMLMYLSKGGCDICVILPLEPDVKQQKKSLKLHKSLLLLTFSNFYQDKMSWYCTWKYSRQLTADI